MSLILTLLLLTGLDADLYEDTAGYPEGSRGADVLLATETADELPDLTAFLPAPIAALAASGGPAGQVAHDTDSPNLSTSPASIRAPPLFA